MKNVNIAILGATGAVGREMIKVLLEKDFDPMRIRTLASARSAGKVIECMGHKFTVAEATDASFAGMDIVLGAASNALAKQFAPAIKAAGAVFVDNSSAFRLDADVPLVVPEINPEDAYKHNGIIANPNCSTIISMMALYPLAKIAPIKSIIASTYQAVSGAGAGGLAELEQQVADFSAGKEVKNEVFPYQILFNLIPQIGSATENGYTTEEMKMQNEGRKIMHLPEMNVTCTCVRVPVLRSHSISISVQFDRKITVEEARAAIAAADGLKLSDEVANGIYPMPLDTSDQDLVFVGRIRDDLALDNALSLWCCGDQTRKGAAANAVQIAELLVK